MIGFLSSWKVKLSVLGVVLAAMGAALLKAFLAGKASAWRAADRANLKAMRKRKEVDHEVEAMDRADIDQRINEYMRDDR
jgi:hypothetical protein